MSIRVRHPRCPRCRCKHLIATETTEANMDFTVKDGVVSRLSHTDEFGGFVGIYLTCTQCRHGWKPRGVNQIYDLGEPAP